MLKIEFLKLVGHYTSARDACCGAVSLEAPISVSDDIGLTLGDTIPDETDDYEAIDDELYHEWVSCEVRNAVKHLTPQQRDIIEKHYFQGIGMKEIANEYGISTQAISQKEKKGFQYLRLDKTLIEIAGVLLKTEPKKTYCYYSKTGFNAWRNYGGSIQERILLNY